MVKSLAFEMEELIIDGTREGTLGGILGRFNILGFPDGSEVEISEGNDDVSLLDFVVEYF